MSKGLGKVERFILETLYEEEPYPVALLSDKYCRSCGVRCDKPSGEMLYHSVARAVRSLERKGYVQTKKIALKKLNPSIKGRHTFNNFINPTYIKLVEIVAESGF